MKRLTYISIIILATSCHKEVLQPMQQTVVFDTVVNRFRIIDSLPANLDSIFKNHVGAPKDTLILKHHK